MPLSKQDRPIYSSRTLAVTGWSCLLWKTCEHFERRLDQLRTGARRSRKARQSPELLPMNNLWPLERRFDHPPSNSHVTAQRWLGSATRLPHWKCHCRQWLTRSDIPRIVKLMLSAVNDDNCRTSIRLYMSVNLDKKLLQQFPHKMIVQILWQP